MPCLFTAILKGSRFPLGQAGPCKGLLNLSKCHKAFTHVTLLPDRASWYRVGS